MRWRRRDGLTFIHHVWHSKGTRRTHLGAAGTWLEEQSQRTMQMSGTGNDLISFLEAVPPAISWIYSVATVWNLLWCKEVLADADTCGGHAEVSTIIMNWGSSEVSAFFFTGQGRMVVLGSVLGPRCHLCLQRSCRNPAHHYFHNCQRQHEDGLLDPCSNPLFRLHGRNRRSKASDATHWWIRPDYSIVFELAATQLLDLEVFWTQCSVILHRERCPTKTRMWRCVGLGDFKSQAVVSA